MKVLLTGGTGFLGGAVARALAARGHVVRLLVRGPGRKVPGFETSPGDVTDAKAVRRAAEGCEAVVHMAGLVKMWVPEREQFDAVNVGGFENARVAARAAGARLLYTSSFIAVGPTGPEAVDESRRHPGGRYRNDYERTKARADERALAAAQGGEDIVVVYPGVVYGPGDLTDGNLVAGMVRDHLQGRLPGIVGPGDRLWSYAFVDDVAAGHVAALERGGRGERYFLCGDNVDMNGFFAALEAVAGVAPPARHVPYGVATVAGAVQWLWAELTGRPPRLTHEVVRVFREHWAYSSAKAEGALGYPRTPLEEGLRRTVAWLREVHGA